MSDILEEVNEEYEFNKQVALVKRALPIAAGLTLFLIVSFGIYGFLRDRNIAQKEARSFTLYNAMIKQSISQDMKNEALMSLTVLEWRRATGGNAPGRPEFSE